LSDAQTLSLCILVIYLLQTPCTWYTWAYTYINKITRKS